MEELKFRPLRADEIEVRVQSVFEKGVVLLIYKDARVDMDVLDETVGTMNWKRSHSRDNANCTVSIWDAEKKEWVGKEDTGTESTAEKEKGLASDSFKRACVLWGIGRELYHAPFIWIPAEKCEIKEGKNGKLTCRTEFKVSEIDVDDYKRIKELVICNKRTGAVVYSYGTAKKAAEKKTEPAPKGNPVKASEKDIEEIKSVMMEDMVAKNADPAIVLARFGVNALDDMTSEQAKACKNWLSMVAEAYADAEAAGVDIAGVVSYYGEKDGIEAKTLYDLSDASIHKALVILRQRANKGA